MLKTPDFETSDRANSTPPRDGYFGAYGGQFVAETLMPAIEELTKVWDDARNDPAFKAEFERLLKVVVGRPSPLTLAARLTEQHGGAEIWLKREDLNHTGAHKINNAVGQVLLAQRMGKKRIIAETGAGQHGVATATVCAMFGLECVVYMGAVDMARQAPNVQRMRLMGTTVVAVEAGSKTLKDAVSAAIQDWIATSETSHYLIGSAIGPHPFPTIVAELQSVIGRESRAQLLEQTGALPDAVIACVGGGSNAIGMFAGFLDDETVRLIGVQSGGETGGRTSPLISGRPGVLHGTATYLVQDADGQVEEAHSVAPGLDYPAVGPQHAFLKDSGRAEYVWVSDEDALLTFQHLARVEGIIGALESVHAVFHATTLAPQLGKGKRIIVNLSGRGDKDLAAVMPRIDLGLAR